MCLTVLYILDPAITGGATKSVIRLITEMLKLGVEPVVCTSSLCDVNAYLSSKGISNYSIGHVEMITETYSGGLKSCFKNFKKTCRYLIQDYRAFQAIRQILKNKKIDIIHTNSSRSDIGFFVSLFYRIPHVVHLREFGDLDYGCYPLNPFYISYYNALASRFICVSNSVQQHWSSKGINRSKMTVIYNGIDTSNISISSDGQKQCSSLRIIMCGSLRPSKGQHLAIEAIGMLSDNIKRNIELDFIGWTTKEYSQFLFDLSIRYDVERQIHILEPTNDVLPLLGKYDIGLMCSKSEGFGRVTAEYMHARLGVIASDSGANPELITHRKTGLLFESGNAQSLAEMIMLFYEDRQLLINCSTAAQEKAMNSFTATINATTIYDQYVELLS